MGWLRKRKREQEKQISPPKECDHLWKDFPWYLNGTYDAASRTVELKVYEPYVCIKCKKRKDVLLDSYIRNNISSYNESNEVINKRVENYEEYIKPKAVVEDMVNDEQLVDRQALNILAMLRGETGSEHSLRYVKSDGTVVEYEAKE